MGRDRSSHAPATHARLHKRGNSASSMTSPLSPASSSSAYSFNRPGALKNTFEESWIQTEPPMPAATSHHNKIKPYIRKLSSKDHNGLDLSRPAAENEGLAGLGISDYSSPSGPRSISDVSFTPVNGRHRHTRSTSNTSQFSTSSGGLQRPTPLPPIRQPPSQFVTPISQSTPPSLLGNDNEGDDIMSDDEFRLRQNAYDPSRRSGSLSSAQGTSLRLHTNGSSTRLAGSYSQSSVSLTSPPVAHTRSRGDTLKSIDTTTSPSSRTSFDHATRFIRGGGRDSPIDPATRAASIRAARQKFEEEERAKERKYEKEATRLAERELRKQLKKDELQARKSESNDRATQSRSRSVSDAHNEKAPRPSVGGRQYSDHRQAHSNSLPKYVATVDLEKQGSNAAPQITKSRAAKGTWLRFITWFKTRLLRMSSKVPR